MLKTISCIILFDHPIGNYSELYYMTHTKIIYSESVEYTVREPKDDEVALA